jgi:hypothetical protein
MNNEFCVVEMRSGYVIFFGLHRQFNLIRRSVLTSGGFSPLQSQLLDRTMVLPTKLRYVILNALFLSQNKTLNWTQLPHSWELLLSFSVPKSEELSKHPSINPIKMDYHNKLILAPMVRVVSSLFHFHAESLNSNHFFYYSF